jgi:predicted Zn-dependent peptidase
MRQFVQISDLTNGLRVASEKMSGSASVSVGIWLPRGSRYEEVSVNGLCHFYEHMVFKGTKRRSALQIAREVEDRGGSLNAFTTKEHTCFYARVVQEDLPLALDVLSDLLMEPLLDEKEFEKERKVIIEEIRSYDDMPDELASDLFNAAHYQGCGLAYPIAGNIRSVKAISRQHMLDYQRAVLREAPLLLCVAGNVEHDWLVEQCHRYFRQKKSGPLSVVDPYASKAGIRTDFKEVQQANVVFGTSQADLGKRQRFALNLFNVAFGSGMASRLFQKVREEHGLAYSIYSNIDAQIGSRGFTINLATDVKKLPKAMQLIRNELLLFVREGFAENELERTRMNILGGIKLGMDSTSNRQNRLARQLLRSGSYTSLAQTEKAINALSAVEVQDVVRSLVLQGNWSVGAVLPKGSKAFDFKPYLDFSEA